MSNSFYEVMRQSVYDHYSPHLPPLPHEDDPRVARAAVFFSWNDDMKLYEAMWGAGFHYAEAFDPDWQSLVMKSPHYRPPPSDIDMSSSCSSISAITVPNFTVPTIVNAAPTQHIPVEKTRKSPRQGQTQRKNVRARKKTAKCGRKKVMTKYELEKKKRTGSGSPKKSVVKVANCRSSSQRYKTRLQSRLRYHTRLQSQLWS